MYCTLHAGSVDAGVTGDDEDEEENEEMQNSLVAVDPVRMGSIGCKEEEQWKR